MPLHVESLIPSSKWVEAVASLNDITQTGKIIWEVDAASPNGPSPRIYRARYLGKWFRLTAIAGDAQVFGTMTFGKPSEYLLEILDDAGTPLFRVPESSGLKDLYQSVQVQLSGINDILEALLKERSSRA